MLKNRPGFDLVTIPRDLLALLIDYAERFAQVNDEPSDGDCWHTIDRATEIRDTET